MRPVRATADLGKVAEAKNGPCLGRGMVAVPCHMLGQYRGPLRRQEPLWQVSPVSGAWARPCPSAQVAQGMRVIRSERPRSPAQT